MYLTDGHIEHEIDEARGRLVDLSGTELEALKRRDRTALEAAWAAYDAVSSNLRAVEQRQGLARATESAVDQPLLSAITNRWQGYGPWCAPPRNVLWVETSDGQPIAAVTCTHQELARGELERRREALAHAPDDIQILLRTVRTLEQRCAALSEAFAGALGQEQQSATPPSLLRAVA